MKDAPHIMIAMMVGAVLCTVPVSASAAQRTAGEAASKVVEGDSSKSGSSRTTKEKQVKKDRRSSGKQIIEDTSTEKRDRSDPVRPEGGKVKPSSTTSEFGSGGSGVTGATGR